MKMKTEAIQRSIESKANMFLGKIVSEFNLDFDKVPVVYYLHKDLSIDELVVPKKFDEDDFLLCRGLGKSYVDLKSNLIFIAKDKNYIVAEEIGHFVHINVSSLNYEKGDIRDSLFKSIIVEMFGFFMSKIFVPNRSVKPFDLFGDFLNLEDKDLHAARHLFKAECPGVDIKEFFIYQQGYGLGQKLYSLYKRNIVDNNCIKELLEDSLDKKGSAEKLFYAIKSLD